MKAVIMAGGEGKRLRPLTCTVPKPMVRISGKPVIEYIFDLLIQHGIEDAYVSLGYLPHIIENNYENGYKNLNLIFSTEDEPLGTAGGVKFAAKGCDDTLLVISGDAVCDFDLSGILRFHEASGAKVTVVAKEVEDPGEYGLITTGEKNRIIGFIEKPSFTQSVSNLANTGVYIISHDILERIPDDIPYDFSKDLFPALLEESEELYCYKTDGYWCDVGSIESYLACQKDALDGRFATEKINIYDMGKINAVPPVFIGENVDISASAKIGPYACIDDNTVIADGAKIAYSTVLENAFIGKNATVNGALLCSGSAIGKGSCVFENSVVGAGAVISKNAVVKSDVRIWPGKVIPSNESVASDVKYGSSKKSFFLSDCEGSENDCEPDIITCVKLGCAVSACKKDMNIAVATDGTKTSESMATAFISGARSCGASVWNFGHAFKSQLDYFVSFCEFDCGVIFSSVNGRKISLCGEGGLPATRQFERKVMSAMQNSDYAEVPENSVNSVFDVSNVKQLYERELFRIADKGLDGIEACFECSNPLIKATVDDVFTKLGGKQGDEIIFKSDSQGYKISAVNNDREYDYHTLLAVVCFDELKCSRDISVPYDSPEFIDKLAESCGRKVYRYLEAPCDGCDLQARKIASKQFFLRDALFMAIKILSIMKKRGESLEILCSELPEKYVVNERKPLRCKPSSLVGIIGKENVELKRNSEGLRVNTAEGRLLVIPERSGEWVKILAEADSMEAAQEMYKSVAEILDSFN